MPARRLAKARWEIAAPHPEAAQLARQINTAPLVAQMLLNRGIGQADEARCFLNPKLSDMHDPALLPGVTLAARRIAAAVAAKQRIVIYGDYDVDGVTGVAILHSCLRMIAADVHFYVPHRMDEGYGVNAEAVAKIVADGTKLMITVDCGITACEPLAAAADAGLDVIVTDHHSPGEALPRAVAIVHPSLPGSNYPNPHLSGSGVAFKLAWQIAREMCGQDRVDARMREFLIDATCLAALGTIADVVPLVGENRSLAVHGLKALMASKHPGIRALIECSGLGGDKLDAYHVGFVLGPRINACGRMGHAQLAVELFTTAPPDECVRIATYLTEQNANRQKVEREIAAQAQEMVLAAGMHQASRRAVVLASEQWHSGVIGIVASRLVEKFCRPAILLAIGPDGLAQGSGRSIPGFHMRDALAACAEHLEHFGGHAMAGGLRLKKDRIEQFTASMLNYASMNIRDEQLLPALRVDAQTNLAALCHNVVEHLTRLAPFGQSNPRPLVAIRNCRILTPPKRIGRSGQSISMLLAQDNVRMRAVGFNLGELADELVGVNQIDIAAEPVINDFNGSRSVELHIRDVAISQS